MPYRILSRLIIVLIVMITGVACGVWWLVDKEYLFFGMSLVVVGWMVALAIKLFNSTTKKAAFMFNAIENNDFTFQFAENIGSLNERHFNHALNRIKDLINQTKKSIHERDRYYEKILDKSTSGIMVIDPTSGVVYQVNKAVLDMFGLVALTHINQLSIVGDDIARAMLDATSLKNSIITFYNETSKVILSLRAASVEMNGRELTIISLNDIGKELDREQTESWTKLSRVLTHEIMNSLSPITSLSAQLQTTTDPQILHRGLEVIGRSSEGLIQFVDNYRRLTRIPTPNLSSFSLGEMVEKQVELLDHPIDISAVDGRVTLLADENLIGQVIVNLLKNAIRATDEGGEVWVRGYINSLGPVIEVCNSGTPIDPLIRDNIFVPFFTTRPEGSGIGLSLSRQIMRLHNGTLTHSDRQTKNAHVTVFTLQF